MGSDGPLMREQEQGLLRLTINRPERRNALDLATVEGLRAALEQAGGDPAVRAVVVRGAGGAFCAGADLQEMGERRAEGGEGVEARLEGLYLPLFELLRTIAKPVVAAVEGPAVGIGCSLALACDLVVAARSAFFSLAFVNIGLAPDGGASLLVPARAGAGRYLELAMLGERVEAQRAYEWGLINRVFADERFEQEAAELVQKLANGPTRAYAAIKRQAAEVAFGRFREAFLAEAKLQAELAQTADAAEGVVAFLERRKPRFSGS